MHALYRAGQFIYRAAVRTLRLAGGGDVNKHARMTVPQLHRWRRTMERQIGRRNVNRLQIVASGLAHEYLSSLLFYWCEPVVIFGIASIDDIEERGLQFLPDWPAGTFAYQLSRGHRVHELA